MTPDSEALPGVFALLDDAAQPGARSRLCTGLVADHVCTDPAGLDACWAAVQADLARGRHAVLLADYEWGAALQGQASRHRSARLPALRVLMFERLQWLDAAQAEAWLAGPAGGEPAPAGVGRLQAQVDEPAFQAAIAAIHEAIRAGETYQVNYTYRLDGQAWGDPRDLYRRLRRRQPVAFGALIALPDDGWVLSLSPELFLEVRGTQVRARPMKGTAARAEDPAEDRARAAALQSDVKNRAENLMIVDLLRNDLGRLAVTGSVRVPALFEVEPYRTVWQMTSTIEATLRPGTDWPALVRATFPCGSITGAPKRRTMGLIDALEASARGLYCGAIGWVEAAGPEGPGDGVLSVAIRTAELAPAEGRGVRALSMGVGAGIVLDSVAADERAECELKSRFLSRLDPGLGLIETLRVENGQAPLLERHLARLEASARDLGLPVDPPAWREALQGALAGAGPGTARLRLELRADGPPSIECAPLPALPPGPLRLCLGQATVPRGRWLARHKTTERAVYEGLAAEAARHGAFDALLFSDDGWLLEGGRCNVLYRWEGHWYTPPVEDGLLAGVMRGLLLQDPVAALRERSLHRRDLGRVQAWRICNALRGLQDAVLAR